MSLVLIRAALEQRLDALTPKLPIAYENIPFTPVDGQPYLRAFLIPNTPVDHGIAFDVKEWRGLFQISVMYPLGSGSRDAADQAELLAAHFAPYLEILSGDMKVMVFASPDIASGFPDDGRWHVPVTVAWRASKTV